MYFLTTVSLTLESKKLKDKMAFRATFSIDFTNKAFVEAKIKKWQSGAQTFKIKTSGSTGLPREIELSRALLIWSCKGTVDKLSLKNEKVLCCLPVEKTGGFMQLIRALHYGWQIHFVEPRQNPFNELTPADATITSLTPHQLSKVMNESSGLLGHFNNILIGGAHIEDDVLDQIKKFNKVNPDVIFWETYGMTETASHFALKNITENEKYFTPNGGVKIESIHGQLGVTIEELGICLETNDLAVVTKHKFKILGRVDDVINSGGVKIHPSEIEPKIKKVIADMGLKRDFYLAKRHDDNLGEMAVLVIEGYKIRDEAFLLENLKRELPQYTAPKRIAYTDAIRRTDTGKIIRAIID